MADLRGAAGTAPDWAGYGSTAPFTGAGGSNYANDSTYRNVTTAYNAISYWQLRSQPVFQNLATVKGEHITHTGAAVQFFKKNLLKPTRTSLAELADVVGQRGTDETVTVPMQEYGDAVQLTSLGRAWSMWSLEMDLAHLLSMQMRDSIELITLDAIIKNRNRYRHGLAVEEIASGGPDADSGLDPGNDLRQGTMIESNDFQANLGPAGDGTNSNLPERAGVKNSNETRGNSAAYAAAWHYAKAAKTDTSGNSTIRASTLNLEVMRRVVADMRSNSVPYLSMGCYVAFVHPQQSLDLMEEGDTQIASMISHQVRNKPETFEQGILSKVAGLQFVESPRVPHIVGVGGRTDAAPAKAGTDRPDIYLSPIFGADALAKAYPTNPGYGEWPSMIVSPQIDKLKRFSALAWYGLFGISPFRGNCMSILETKASNSANI